MTDRTEFLAALDRAIPAVQRRANNYTGRYGSEDLATKEAESEIAALFALRDQIAARYWQPIETAPKSRIVLVGYRNALGKWRTLRACYYPENTLEAPEDYDEDFMPAGWYEATVEAEYDCALSVPPTHWMPLPEPPQ